MMTASDFTVVGRFAFEVFESIRGVSLGMGNDCEASEVVCGGYVERRKVVDQPDLQSRRTSRGGDDNLD